MSLAVCAVPGCGELIPRQTRGRRCATHRRQLEDERGSRQARGYGSDHDALRASYQRRMDAGERFTCWRCSTPINPTSWQLGHDDHDRSRYHGPECVPCNAATRGRHPTPPPTP